MSAATTMFQSGRKPAMQQPSLSMGGLLQRKCACGSPAASLTGQCEECQNKRRLQAKLTIGASNDPLEAEADRVADQVSVMPAHSDVRSSPSRIQRLIGQTTGDPGTAPASVDDVLAGSGRSLEPALRQDMEQRFGHDFSNVRVHSGTKAEQSAREVNANAYTVGRDIVFGAGQHTPKTADGRRLIAHELAHVVQQSSGSAPTVVCRQEAARSQGVEQPVMSSIQALANIEFEGARVKNFKQVEKTALRIKQYFDSQNGSVVDLTAYYDASRDTEAGDARRLAQQQAEGLRTVFTLWFNLPKSKMSISTMEIGLLGGGANQTPAVVVSIQPQFSGVSHTIASPTSPEPQSVVVRDNSDPTTLTPNAEKPDGSANWLDKLLADVKTNFAFSEGFTISSISNPGISTSVFVTGVTQKLFQTHSGLAGQAELGWDKSVGFQLSYQDWFLHSTIDTDGKWGVTVSFPTDAPLPVLPWVNDIFRETSVAMRGFVDVAAAGPPNLNNLDSLKKQLSPHIDRIKNSFDACKGIYKASTHGINFSLSIGSGPQPGKTPAEKPSGIFVGSSLVLPF